MRTTVHFACRHMRLKGAERVSWKFPPLYLPLLDGQNVRDWLDVVGRKLNVLALSETKLVEGLHEKDRLVKNGEGSVLENDVVKNKVR